MSSERRSFFISDALLDRGMEQMNGTGPAESQIQLRHRFCIVALVVVALALRRALPSTGIISGQY